MLLKSKAYIFLIGFFVVICHTVSGQDQKVADSLVLIYKSDKVEDTAKLELLRNLAFNEQNDLKLALQYAEELISLSARLGNNLYLHRGYLQKGNKKRLLGNLDEALDAYFKSVEAAGKANFIKGEGTAYSTIADIYSISNNHSNAMLYYRKAISTLRLTNDSIPLGAAISNAGDEFLNKKLYDSALLYFKESGMIFEKIDYPIGKAYNLGNIGMVYANIGKSDLAEKNINEAIPILEKLANYYPICVYLISMSDIYVGKGDQHTALNYALRSLKLAQQYGLKDQISAANLKLSELYEKAGDLGSSFKYYKDHIAFRDSVNNIKSVQQMADLRTNFEVSRKQTEVDLLNQEKRNQQIIVVATVIALILIFLLLLGLFRRYKFMKETNIIIGEEKKRSDTLLLNILPDETAKELKQNGRVKAQKFDSVTVLFTDFKGFTHFATNLPPEKLVESVDFYFSKFDQIIEKYGLEKIKTVGDSYMCAGGLPFPSADHAHKMILAAFDIAEFVHQSKMNKADDETRFDIRIGINTGPIVAGVVGTKKFAYDIWGDTVNIASRMESNSVPGKINISENTYELIKDLFDCEYRGEIEVKNRGMMKMYFVNKPA
jgi:class 3 adenylate cyclase/tetratricopeptide (TPR) repeat protein